MHKIGCSGAQFRLCPLRFMFQPYFSRISNGAGSQCAFQCAGLQLFKNSHEIHALSQRSTSLSGSAFLLAKTLIPVLSNGYPEEG